VAIACSVNAEVPADSQVLGVPVFAGRRLPKTATRALDVGYLAERGFDGKVGQTCARPGRDGRLHGDGVPIGNSIGPGVCWSCKEN